LGTGYRCASAHPLLECLLALRDLLGDLVERLDRALRLHRELAELLADVVGGAVQGVAPARDLILRPLARSARDVAETRHRRVDARPHVPGRLLAGRAQIVDRLLNLVPDAATLAARFHLEPPARFSGICGGHPIPGRDP